MESHPAVTEAAQQRRLREEAEQRAKALEEAVALLKRQEEQARAAIDEAGRKEARAEKVVAQEASRQIEAEPEPQVPESFSPDAARTLLAGKKKAIMSFVVWANTPQGGDFWVEEQRRLEQDKGLSETARQAISEWLKASTKESKGRAK